MYTRVTYLHLSNYCFLTIFDLLIYNNLDNYTYVCTDDNPQGVEVITNKIIDIMLVLKNEKLGKEFNLPQSINDINFEYLAEVVKGINVAKHYCIVALITTAKISDIVDTKNNHVGSTKFVVVKHRDDCANDIIEDGKITMIAPSDAFNGIDCNTTINELSGFNVKSFIDSDNLLRLSIMKGDIFKTVSSGSVKSLILGDMAENVPASLDLTTNKNVVILGFKIVPESSIIASTNNKLKESGTIRYIVDSLKPTITNG